MATVRSGAAAHQPGVDSSGWSEVPRTAEIPCDADQCGWTERLGADVEEPRLVMAGQTGDQRVPVGRPEDCPGRDGSHRRSLFASGHRANPGIAKPAHLLFAGAAKVSLGDRQRHAVALPGLHEHPGVTSNADTLDPGRFHVGILLAAVAPVHGRWILLDAIVEEAVTGDVVVQADHRRSDGVAREPLAIVDRHAGRVQVRPEGMLLGNAAGEQVQAQPPALVFERRLRRHRCPGGGRTGVLRADKLGVRRDLTNGRHRLDRGARLVHQCGHEGRIVPPVWIPVAVQGGKTRRRQRLVDRRIQPHPWVAARERRRVFGQLVPELFVEEICRCRTAAMVNEADDRLDAVIAKQRQRRVAPAPVGTGEPVRRRVLPQGRPPDFAKSHRGHLLDEVGPRVAADEIELIDETIAEAIDRAFDPTPQFERPGGECGVGHAVTQSLRRTPAIFAKVVSACATT